MTHLGEQHDRMTCPHLLYNLVHLICSTRTTSIKVEDKLGINRLVWVYRSRDGVLRQCSYEGSNRSKFLRLIQSKLGTIGISRRQTEKSG